MNISIILKWKNIKSDINHWTYRMAESVEDARLRNMMQSGEDVSDREYFHRLVQQGAEQLHLLLRKKITNMTLSHTDYAFVTKQEWQYTFNLDRRSIADAKSLGEAMHSYILYYALTEWSRYADAKSYTTLKESMAESLEKIRYMVFTKNAPTLPSVLNVTPSEIDFTEEGGTEVIEVESISPFVVNTTNK